MRKIVDVVIRVGSDKEPLVQVPKNAQFLSVRKVNAGFGTREIVVSTLGDSDGDLVYVRFVLVKSGVEINELNYDISHNRELSFIGVASDPGSADRSFTKIANNDIYVFIATN